MALTFVTWTALPAIVSEVSVVAPADGIVIARTVNAGQVVAPGQDLFVVTDLATVWIIGDVCEKDFGAVRVGTSASVATPAAPSRPIHGRVAYIDPRVETATRTAKVRVEVPGAACSSRARPSSRSASAPWSMSPRTTKAASSSAWSASAPRSETRSR